MSLHRRKIVPCHRSLFFFNGRLQIQKHLPHDFAKVDWLGWTFQLDNNAAQMLAAGETVSQTWTIAVQDNWGSLVTQDIVINIHGADEANLAPVANPDTNAGNAVIEAGVNVSSMSEPCFHYWCADWCLTPTFIGLPDGPRWHRIARHN